MIFMIIVISIKIILGLPYIFIMLPSPVELEAIWISRLQRRPLELRYKIVDSDDANLTTACNALKNDPLLPNLLSIDVECYHGPKNSSFSSWNQKWKNFPIDQLSNPNIHGPYVCCLQLARPDSLCYLFDLFTLHRFPQRLVELLTDSRITWIGFNWERDWSALVNTWKPLRGLPNINADPHKILQGLQNHKTLTTRIFGDITDWLSGGTSLSNLEHKMFDLWRPKPIWIEQDLNRPLSILAPSDLEHMVKDAIGHLDTFLALHLRHNALLHFRNKLEKNKQ